MELTTNTPVGYGRAYGSRSERTEFRRRENLRVSRNAGAGRGRVRRCHQPADRARDRRRGAGQARGGPRRRHGRAHRRARARRARVRGRTSTSRSPSAARPARSAFPTPRAGGRKDLPGEHGFRFFPGFYHHIPDTMRRIPDGNNPEGVYNNLLGVTGGRSVRVERPRRRAAVRDGPRPERGARASTACGALLIEGIAKQQDGAAAGDRVLRRARARLLHLVRRAPLRRVGVRAVVGLHRRRRAAPPSTRRSSPRASLARSSRRRRRSPRRARSATWPRRSS